MTIDDDFAQHGFCRIPATDVGSPALADLYLGHGGRDLLRRFPVIRAWASSPAITSLVRRFLATDAVAISGMWFDKLPTANWQVPWHQDRHLPVHSFVAHGWGPWTVKDGLPYVEAPEPWASARIAIRLHLDACPIGHGHLTVIPGSHRHGVLAPEHIDALVGRGPVIPLSAEVGDLLILHPLLLHRSSPAYRPGHRRVIHVEWCAMPLPAGGVWASDLSPTH